MSGINEPQLGNLLEDELTRRGVRIEAFRQIVGRLLGLSIVHREDSAIERQLYDDSVRIEGLLTDYFEVAGGLRTKTIKTYSCFNYVGIKRSKRRFIISTR